MQHLAPELSGVALLHRLAQYKSFDASFARHGEAIKHGQVYLAPPDFLLVKEKKVLVTKAARENGFRPGVDPLFRSAAVTHGHHVIGIILMGFLDDGTAGLIAVKRCGERNRRDPKDASYPAMPQGALHHAAVDYSIPVSEKRLSWIP